jgi:hypothetical protein
MFICSVCSWTHPLKRRISLHLSHTTRRLGQAKETRCSTHNICFLALKMFDTSTNKNWLENESVVYLGRPLWRAKLRGGTHDTLQEFAQFKLQYLQHENLMLVTIVKFRIDKTPPMCFVDWVSFYPQWHRLIPVLLQLTWRVRT